MQLKCSLLSFETSINSEVENVIFNIFDFERIKIKEAGYEYIGNQ